MKNRTYKTLMKNDYYNLRLYRCCNSNRKFLEYNIEGIIKIEYSGKRLLDLKIRVLTDKQTGEIGYVVVEYYYDPASGKAYKQPYGYIARSDKELLEKIPRMKQEYLDKVAAALLAEKMAGD